MRLADRSTPEPNTGCWLWLGAVASHGYGCVNGKTHGTTLAHRAIYQEEKGVKLRSSDWLLHSCDNRLCVSPHHLRIGTASDNARDREKRGRGFFSSAPEKQVRGARHGNFKVGIYNIFLAREMWATRQFSQREIANEIGCSQGHVSEIVTFKTAAELGGTKRE